MNNIYLTDSEWRYRLINEVIADYMFVIDVEHDGSLKLNWVSENLLVNTGRSLSETITPDTWKSIIHPDDLGLFYGFISQMLTGTEKGELECRSFHQEGHIRWISIFARHRKDPDGRLTHLIGAVRDITERKLIEERLLRSEQKYRKLHSSITDAFVSVNMKGELLEFNEAYMNMLGYSETELQNLTYLDLTPSKWHAEESRIVEEEIIPKGSSGVYEKEYIRKGGTILPVEIRTFLIRDDEGNPAAMWAIVRDISERKLNNEKLKTALEEKDTLLREIHHRVKNNLQTVMTLIDLRSSDISDTNSLRIFSEIKEQIRTISIIYHELFQHERLSRVEMQAYLSLLVSHLVKTFHNGYKVQVDVDCGDEVLDAEWAMPCGLIVNELVTNALKHAFPVEFTNKALIKVRLWRENEFYVLQVSDNGTGFAPIMLEQSTSSIGLQLVSLWAKKQMNGSLDIASKNGACFTIRFSRVT